MFLLALGGRSTSSPKHKTYQEQIKTGSPCGLSLQSEASELGVASLEALTPRIQPLGMMKAPCFPEVLAPSPELPQSVPEQDSGELGLGVCLFLYLPRFLNGPKGKRLGDRAHYTVNCQ